jgi:hypothetical protein
MRRTFRSAGTPHVATRQARQGGIASHDNVVRGVIKAPSRDRFAGLEIPRTKSLGQGAPAGSSTKGPTKWKIPIPQSPLVALQHVLQIPHALPPNDPDAKLGTQPLVNVVETDIDYTMGQNDYAVLATVAVVVTLTPSPLTITPVLIVADGGIVTVDGGANPIQGGPVTVAKGTAAFFSFSPLSGSWSVAKGGGGGGGVTSVTGTSPIASSGGLTPDLSFDIAGQTQGDLVYFDGAGWTRLPAGTPGQLLQTEGNAANPQWTTPAPPTSAGWTTALDLDLSAQGNQTLAPDGPYTIGGVVWNKINTTNEAAPTAIVAGQGLVIQPASATDYSNDVRSLPAIMLPLTSLTDLSNIDWSTPLRLWAWVSVQNIAANYDGACIGLDVGGTSTSPTTAGNLVYYAQKIHDAGQTFLNRTMVYNATANSNSASPNFNNQTMMLEIPDGIAGLASRLFTGAAPSGGVWPAPKTLDPNFYNTFVTATGLNAGATDLGELLSGAALSYASLILGASRAGSGTALSITIARVRIDFHP